MKNTMFNRIVICIIPLLFGCSMTSKIPAPTEGWRYGQTKDETGADYKLRILMKHKTHGESLSDLYFVAKDRNSNSFYSYPVTIMMSGAQGSIYSSVSVHEISETGINVSILKAMMSDNLNYDFDHEITITYDQTGKVKFNDVTYIWEWIKINPNHH